MTHRIGYADDHTVTVWLRSGDDTSRRRDFDRVDLLDNGWIRGYNRSGTQPSFYPPTKVLRVRGHDTESTHTDLSEYEQ